MLTSAVSRARSARPRSARWRAPLGRVGKAAIGIAILIYLFTFIPVPDVVSAFWSAAPGWIALAFCLRILERIAAAVRVTILTRLLGMPLSIVENWKIGLVSMFYGTFLPGQLAGGAVRWYRMSQPNRMRAEAAAAITFDRLIGTITLVFFGLVFWFLENPTDTSPTFQIPSVVLLSGLVGGLCFSMSRRATSVLFKPLAKIAYQLRLRPIYAAFEKVLGSVQQFRHLRPPAVAALAVATVGQQLLAISVLVALASSLGLGVGLITLGWIGSFIGVALLLPVSVSGVGVREGALVILLAPYGVSGSSAVALALLVLLTQLLIAGGGGLLELKTLFSGVVPRSSRGTRKPDCNHIPGQTV